MACPYFAPTQRAFGGGWLHPARLPLGAGWEGCCDAPGHEGFVPDSQRLQQDCSLGYASSCPHLPGQRAWDAVRFCVATESESYVHVAFVCERDHLPIEHGKLEYRIRDAAWTKTHADTRVQRLADCFLQAWLQKGRSSGEEPRPETTV